MAVTQTLANDENAVTPILRKIGVDDIKQALLRGFDDFQAMPTHAIFVTLIYPIVGVIIAAMTFGYDLVPLLFPLASGFALIGPLAAVGLYDLSRRREQGRDTSWSNAFGDMSSSTVRSILFLGLILAVIFVVWIIAAHAIYWTFFGSWTPGSIGELLVESLTTPRGWGLILVGNLVGFAFALVVLALSAISFPMLLDQPVDAGRAMSTSIRVMQENPRTILIWGLVVAVLMIVGSIPFFFGLAVTLPVLGHATWHLYRLAVER